MSKIIFEIDMNDLPGARKAHEMLGKMLDNELPWEVDPKMGDKIPTPESKAAPVVPTPQVATPEPKREIDASKVGFGQSGLPAPQVTSPVVPTPPAPQVTAPVVPTPPAPQVTAPVVPTPPAPQVQDDLDARGFPWDERIHSSSKAINKDGTWKKKRGIQPKLVDEVEAEYKTGQVAHVQQDDPVTSSSNPMKIVNDFIENITSAVQLGEVSEDDLYSELKTQGLNGLTDVIKRPDIIPALVAKFIPHY